jgi:hypothetical protein
MEEDQPYWPDELAFCKVKYFARITFKPLKIFTDWEILNQPIGVEM